MNPHKKIVMLVSIIVLSALSLTASTIGIATGSKTADGRPLLFKNKDRTDNYPSDVGYYPGSADHYAYVFQENYGESHLKARMGINSAGFAIVYTTSENLQGAGTGPSGSEFAAMALKICSTIQDFRDLLELTAGKRNVHDHFGVIDSSGAGSLFEADGFSHVEIPIIDSIGVMANTAKYHPNAGAPASKSTSPEREARAVYLLTHGAAHGLDYRYFLNEITKDFCTIQAHEDAMPVGQYKTDAVLSRYKTAASCVIKGAKSGDDPKIESVMWLTLGEPSFAVAVPFTVNAPDIAPNIRAASEDNGMAGSIDRMRTLIYDYTDGRYSDKYADTYQLMKIRAFTIPFQDSMCYSYSRHIEKWRSQTADKARQDMEDWVLKMQIGAKDFYDSLYVQLSGTKIDNAPSMPIKVQLLRNYPNPFNSATTIQYNLSQTRNVELAVFNLIGQRIATLTNQRQKAGSYSVVFKAGNLPGGVYICRLRINNSIFIRKMILLK